MGEPIIPTRARSSIAADVQDELETWIEERTAELIAGGVPAPEARRRAIEEFGDVDQTRQYALKQDIAADRRIRVLLWIEELGADLRIAWRTLLRTPTVTAVVLLTFALGLGATTAVFSVVHALLFRPLPYGDETSLVYLPALDDGVIRPGLGGARHSATVLTAVRDRNTSFEGIAGISTGNLVVTDQNHPEQVGGADFTNNAFQVLRISTALGRPFDPALESSGTSPVIVLSDALWRRRFQADPGIIGRRVEFSGTTREIIGVMPPGFRVPTYEHAEFIVPHQLGSILQNPDNAHVRFLRLFARLRPGVSPEVAQADVDRIMRSLQTEYPRALSGIEARVVPIRSAVAGDTRPRLVVLMAAAGFVLLIACANVAGILLSRAIARRHELSVRVALGAGRRRLIRQFLAEGVVLAGAGVALGLVIAQLGIALLRGLSAEALPAGTTFQLEPGVVLFALTVAIAAALGTTLIPAFAVTRDPGTALRRDQRASMSHSSRKFRLGLVAGQLAVSVVLLIGAGLFLRTLHRLSALDLGYDTEQALTFRVQFGRPRSHSEQDVFWSTLYDGLRGVPGVRQVGGGNLPLSGQSTIIGLEIENRITEQARRPDVRYTPASDEYFATLGIPILKGRGFQADDQDGAPWVALVSAELARQLWSDADPIGARVKTGPDRPWATIIGVVGDVRMGSADQPVPSIYTSQRQDHWPGGGTVIVRFTGDPEPVGRAVREVVHRVDPGMPVIGLRSLEEFRRTTPAIAERRMLLQLMLAFAVVALAVSAIGVYGVGAYATEARQREFGLRLALGSSRAGVLRLALGDGIRVAVLGVLAGIPLAWLMASRLRGLLYSVEPFDPLIAVTVLGALFGTALAASMMPARKASLIEPGTAMRTD